VGEGGTVTRWAVYRGMYILISEVELYMEFGIQAPIGWYLFFLSPIILADT